MVSPLGGQQNGLIIVNVAASVALNATGVGNTAAQATQAYDTAVPTATATITTVTDNVGNIQGALVTGGVTDDTSLVLSGGIAGTLATGDVVAVYDNGIKLGNATVSGSTWSYTDNTLVNGDTVSYTVLVEDAAGNQNTSSTPFTLTIDTIAPLAINDAGNAVEAGGVNNGTAGSNATGNVLTNDTDLSTPLSILQVGTGVSAGTAGNVGQQLAGTYGTLTLNSDGSYSYAVNNANATVNALAAARNATPAGTLTDTFTYIARDKAGINSNNATLIITITAQTMRLRQAMLAQMMQVLPSRQPMWIQGIPWH